MPLNKETKPNQLRDTPHSPKFQNYKSLTITLLGESYYSVEIHLVYYVAPNDKAS